MLKKSILKKLTKLNKEEKEILKNKNFIDKTIFNKKDSKMINFDKVVTTGEIIMIRKHTRFTHYPSHKHDFIEINFVLDGSVKQQINNEIIDLKKGDLLFIGPEIEHEIFKCNEGDIMINIVINPLFFQSLISFLDANNPLSEFIINTVFNNLTPKALLFSNLLTNKEIISIISNIILELDSIQNNISHISKIKFLIGLLLIELFNITPYMINKDNYENQLIIKVLNFIQNNLQDASLKKISSDLIMKDYNLAKIIKKHLGMTFKEIVINTRLEKACDFLINTNITILEIANKFGFSNSSFFHKEFKKKFGVSPKFYRQNHSQLNN